MKYAQAWDELKEILDGLETAFQAALAEGTANNDIADGIIVGLDIALTTISTLEEKHE